MSEANWEDTIKDIEVIIYTDNPDRFYRYCEFLETLDILLSEEGSDKARIQDVKNNIQEQLTKERQQRRDEAWRIYRLPETSLKEKEDASKRAIAPELFCDDKPEDTEEYQIYEMLRDETWPAKRVELYLSYLEFYREIKLYQQSYADQSEWISDQLGILDRLKLLLNQRDAMDDVQYIESIYSSIYARKQDVDSFIERRDTRDTHKDFVPLIKRYEHDAQKNPDFMSEVQMLREEYALHCLDVALRKFTEATGVNVNEWETDKPRLNPNKVLKTIEDALWLGILNMMPNRMGQPGYEHLKLNGDRSIVPEAYFITSNNAARVEEFKKTKLALDQALDVTLELQAFYKKPDYEKTLSEIYKIQSIWSANEIQSLANFKQEQLAKDLEHKKSSLDDKLYRLTEADISHVIEAFEKSELNSLDAPEQVRKYVSDKLNELKALRSRLSDYSKWTRDMSEMIEKAERLLKSSSVEVERIKPLVETVEQELAQFELNPDLNDRWYDLRKAYNNLVGGQERFENVRKYYINGSWENVITVGTYYKNSSALTDEDAPYHDEGHKMYLFAEANLAYSQAKKMGQLEEKRNTKLQKARELLAGLDDTWRGRNELFAQVEQLLFDTQKYQSDNAKARELSKEIAPTEDWLDRNEYVKALQKISDAEKEGDKAQYAILRDDTLKNWQTKIEQEITALQNERYFDNVSRSHIEKLKENIAALKEHGRSINVSLETSFNRKETQILLRDYEAEHRYRGEGLRKQRNYFGLPIKLGLNDYQSWLDILSKDFNAKNKDIAEISAYCEIAKICDEYGSLEDQLKKLEAFYNDLDGQEDIANHIIIDAVLAGYESLISQKAANDKFTSKEQVDDYFAAMRKYQDLLLHRAGYGDEIAMLSHLWEDFIIAFETSLRLNRKQASVYNSDTRTSATKSFNELDKLNMRAKNYQASDSLWLGYRTCFMMSIVEERKRMDKAAIQSYLRTASISDGSLATLLEYAFILKEDKDNVDEVLVQLVQSTIDNVISQIPQMYLNLQQQIDHAAFDSFVDSLSDSLKQLQGLEYQITAIDKGLRGINNNDRGGGRVVM